ncbi:hypothetical protein AJ79_05235 [Helicocarpus griseus UAMH5409]|uniref:Amidohydrolase-related domain-containing protein n=1 Tax=Helicocarpus griseus UAMH5409 TaxID=1447875 RepID=A0A2B7XPL5_9EURO|nr:hypothetical protein AJ79_05235 [Helicocarpus griseus UAMH5409]
MPTSLLLQNGTILAPNPDDSNDVIPLREHSLLVEGSMITRIGPHAEVQPPSPDTKVIDCSGKIVSPGFIDTHHHMWQTQLKGRHADQSLIEYMPSGNMQGGNYTAEDIFWGQLGGCLSSIDAGTTTVVDHAHMSYSAAHIENAVSATISSGIRSVFGFTPITRVKSWDPPFTMDDDLFPPWLFETFDKLAQQAPFGDGRVQLGFAMDLWFLPKEIILNIFDRINKAGVKTVTAHYLHGIYNFNGTPLPDILASYNLLGPQILLSHATLATPAAAHQLTSTGTFVSSTPETELQMGHGLPVCFRDDLKSQCSLGIDCHSNNSSDMMTQMRLALQAERSRRNQIKLDKGEIPLLKIEGTVKDVFRLATMQGARAVKMEKEIGSLEVGKRGDVVVFEGRSTGMVCAAAQDPVAAIVLHASVGDVGTVVVDGVVRKREGRLVEVAVEEGIGGSGKGRRVVGWEDVAGELVRSRREIEERVKGIDWEKALDAFLGLYKNVRDG